MSITMITQDGKWYEKEAIGVITALLPRIFKAANVPNVGNGEISIEQIRRAARSFSDFPKQWYKKGLSDNWLKGMAKRLNRLADHVEKTGGKITISVGD